MTLKNELVKPTNTGERYTDRALDTPEQVARVAVSELVMVLNGGAPDNDLVNKLKIAIGKWDSAANEELAKSSRNQDQ